MGDGHPNVAETPDDDPRGGEGWSPEDGVGHIPKEEGGGGNEPRIFTLSDVQRAVRAVHDRAEEERPDDDVMPDDPEHDNHLWADGFGAGATMVLMEIKASGVRDETNQ